MENNKPAKKDFDLDYDDLEITVFKKVSEAVLYPADYACPAEYDEYETEINYTYTLDASDVFEYFWDNWDSYEELVAVGDDDQKLEDYINENLETLFDDHYDDLLEHFKDDAREEAEENYDPDDYGPDWDDYGD